MGVRCHVECSLAGHRTLAVLHGTSLAGNQITSQGASRLPLGNWILHFFIHFRTRSSRQDNHFISPYLFLTAISTKSITMEKPHMSPLIGGQSHGDGMFKRLQDFFQSLPGTSPLTTALRCCFLDLSHVRLSLAVGLDRYRQIEGRGVAEDLSDLPTPPKYSSSPVALQTTCKLEVHLLIEQGILKVALDDVCIFACHYSQH